MKIKTTELTGKALDWAVGRAVGERMRAASDGSMLLHCCYSHDGLDFWNEYSPTTNWGQLGPLVPEFLMTLDVFHEETHATAISDEGERHLARHPDARVAACRAIVAARLGDTVDVPEVLV